MARSGAAGAALATPIVGRGAAFADFDRDGDLDLVITTNHGRPMLLRNDGGNKNHWLAVHLIGTRSNRSGIGAKLFLTIGDQKHLREYGTAGSYLSQSATEAWFGLGQSDHADALTIAWPSGTRQEFKNLPAGRLLHLTEGESGWRERLSRS
jgi:enediyne biosynthesis protein E4